MSLLTPESPSRPLSFVIWRSTSAMDEAERLHHEGHGGGIEVADPVVLGQPGLRAEAHAGADRDAVADAGDGAAAAEMAGNHAQARPLHGRLGPAW